MNDDDLNSKKRLILLKVGGSSITNKAKKETLDSEAIDWFSNTISYCIDEKYLAINGLECNVIDRGSKKRKHANSNETAKASFIIVHGAGSFGHHCAKEFGLGGKSQPPSRKCAELNDIERRKIMTGLSKTRASVKELNNQVVLNLIKYGVNAVGISPCINVPSLMAHGGDEQGGATALVTSINEALMAGLVPVIHGDAGLYGNLDEMSNMSAGILGGDTLVEMIATHKMLDISLCVFLTDVNGVYTKDPKLNPQDARLLRRIDIDMENGNIMTKNFFASGSSHEHDVTGGLETKLGAAAKIAKTGINVIMAKCCSKDAEKVLESKGENKPSIIESGEDFEYTIIRGC